VKTRAETREVRRRTAPRKDAADEERPPERPHYTRAETVAVVQGAYYAATGIWPILHLRSFEAVTGPKAEGWLVKTVGGVIGVVGATLLAAGLRKRVTPEVALLGAGSAAVLGAVDVWYAARGRISPVYLLDALPQAVIAAGWASAEEELGPAGDEDGGRRRLEDGRRGAREIRGRRRGG
jgi:hypothetical protein